MTFGERILKLRTEKGMTQDELAQKLGYKSRSSIAKIENGARDVPRSQIVDLAKALDTTPSVLMGWEDENLTPADSRSEVYEDLNKLSDSDLIKVEGFIKGLLAQDSSDK